MDKSFHPTLYWPCDYLYMLGLKLNHVLVKGATGLKIGHTEQQTHYSVQVQYSSSSSSSKFYFQKNTTVQQEQKFFVNINQYITALLHPAGRHQGSHKDRQAGNQMSIKNKEKK